MELTMPNSPVPGEFFLLMPDTTRPGRGHGVEIENEDELLQSPRLILRPEDGGFPPLKERPRLVLKPKVGDPPEDLEGGMSGYWLVSDRLRAVFISNDPGAFEFVRCDYRLPDGRDGPAYYLCDVVREVDAVDEGASTLRVVIDEDYAGGKFYDLRGGASLAFKKDVLGGAHVFRTPYSGDLVYCDRKFREAIRAAGIGDERRTCGLRFKDAANV
ncbi:DUF1629 domain-containing protein [Stenotrophomonas sp. NPDC077659]|uniref:DUF1629 domain-containing protein n=1 Tax=Stenotrophomonas sp. NPDC077659 TaxID=3390694 RepID=UPI003CFF01B5